MRRILVTKLLILGLILLVGMTVTTTKVLADRGFSNKDVKGDYGVAFDGAFISAAGGPFQPVAAVGQLHADGKGNADFVRTLNIGGLILEQTGTGTYQVFPDGTGTTEFTVTIVSQSPAAPPFPDTFETFSFVIINKRKIEFIGKTIQGIDPDGNLFPVGNGALRGVAKKQSK